MNARSRSHRGSTSSERRALFRPPSRGRASVVVVAPVALLALLLAPAVVRAAGPPAEVTPTMNIPQSRKVTPPPPPVTTATSTPPAADGESPPKLSLPTQTDRDAWLASGFRFGLGASYGRLVGLDGAPSGRLLGFLLRLGLRLDPSWSVLMSFQYALASAPGGLSGLRFAGTIDPTWHATPHLSFALGLGFGGIVEGSTGRADIPPFASTLGSSYTFPTASPPLPSCSGVGAAGLARAEWSVVLGPRSATSLGLEVLGQWTGCVADTGTVEPDTGESIVRRQWWGHFGGTATWGITWR